MMATDTRVTSRDGTSIAFEAVGSGAALILVDAALHYRGFSSFGGLIERLGGDFTTYHYDRRGRGSSSDAASYRADSEVEDLAALIDHAGGSACVFGFSSGGLLALRAAAGGLAIPKLALLEPPIATEGERAEQAAFSAHIAALLARGQRGEVVEYVMSSIGVPAEITAHMKEDGSWEAMESVADTMAYDSILSQATSLELLGSVSVPTLVLDSGGSSGDLGSMADLVADALPHAIRRSLPGQWHGVPDDVLAPALIEFFGGVATT